MGKVCRCKEDSAMEEKRKEKIRVLSSRVPCCSAIGDCLALLGYSVAEITKKNAQCRFQLGKFMLMI